MNSIVQKVPVPISERKILEGGLVVAVVILAGQALGFIRQATIAYLLGTGAQADALAVGIAPVDLWWSVVATTVIFGFGPLLAAGDRRLTVGVLARPVLAVSISATTLLLLFAETAVRIFGPGLAPATAATAAALLRCAGLAIPAVSASTLFTALLYSERRFAFAAFHQGTVSIATIAAAVTLHKWLGPFGFAAGYAGGAWLQLALAWAISRPILRQRGAVACPSTRTVPWSAPLSVLCYSAFIGMNPAVTRALASTFGAGAAVGFDYSLKLIGVPLALLVSPVSSSLLSEIAPFRLRRDGLDVTAMHLDQGSEASIERLLAQVIEAAGGVDILLVETCQDLLQAKAALVAAFEAMRLANRRLPVTVQVTLEATGTMLLGTEIGAALSVLEPFDVDVIGLNCATGPHEMNDAVRFLCDNFRPESDSGCACLQETEIIARAVPILAIELRRAPLCGIQ